MKSLKSTVETQGKYVTQIFHFANGVKRTFHGIDSESIKQGQFTKLRCKDGRMIFVNDANVLCIEIFKED
jgi:hypothetical protein|tara:strand:+ start:861 stop:1070 length:210 start_codon:yes stop_codon:yes gene_type:complete